MRHLVFRPLAATGILAGLFPRLALLIIPALLLTLTPALGAGKAKDSVPFTSPELETFMRDAPGFLDWVDETGDKKFLADLIKDPKVIKYNGDAYKYLKNQGWRPERFAYILNHVVLGGVIKETGGFGDKELNALLEQKERVSQSGDLSPEEKQAALEILDNTIAEIKETIAANKSVPKSELLLMWSCRDRLYHIFLNRLPVQQRSRVIRLY